MLTVGLECVNALHDDCSINAIPPISQWLQFPYSGSSRPEISLLGYLSSLEVSLHRGD